MMATERIADMTFDELNEVIERAVDRRMQYLLKPQDTRTAKELLESIRQHRITPAADAKSARDMLREDRDAPITDFNP